MTAELPELRSDERTAPNRDRAQRSGAELSAERETELQPSTPDDRAETASVPESAVTPRSPAEAFADLADGVGRLQREVGMVADYVRGTGASLQRSADHWRFEGAEAAVGGLIRIHDLLYRQNRDIREDKAGAPTVRLAKLLVDAVEGELASVDVLVFEPREDEDVDLKLMVTVSNESAPLLMPWKRGVASVLSCAYIYRSSLGDRILKKSEVVVWRGRRDIALDVADGENHEEAASSRDRSGDDVLRGGGPEPRGPSGDCSEQ